MIEMSNKILTISIAAYNVEKYLNECLNSLAIDDVLDDIEVLIINDGSNDRTSQIAKKYCEIYPNTFKLINKANGGYGSTYNESIKIASGTFFKLLDGDDTFDKIGLKKLVISLKEVLYTDIDIVFTKFKKFNENKSWKAILFKDEWIDKEIEIKLLKINEGIPMHSMTYRTNVLKKSNMVLPEHLLYTDNYYVNIPLFYSKKVLFKDFNVYNYRIGNVNQSVDKKSKLRHIDDLYYICCDLINKYNELKTEHNICEYIDNRFAATLVDYYVFLLLKATNKHSLSEICEFDNMVKTKSYNLYYCMSTLDRKASKIISIIRKSNYKLYYIIDLLYKIVLK